MRIIDISLTIHPEMVTWQDESKPEITQTSFLRKGDACNKTSVRLDLHHGTHLDAPYHFVEEGKKLEQLDLNIFAGPCFVKEIPDAEISAAVLEKANIPPVKRLLFKTRNKRLLSQPRFSADYTAVSLDGAAWLVAHGINLVGIDYLSIEGCADPGSPVHHYLLRHDRIILEGLNLATVAEGEYELIAFPLKFQDVEASPVRAVLIER